MKRTTYFYAATAALFLGSAIYVLFRSESLLMFHWANTLRLLAFINLLRADARGFESFVPTWFVYSLPFALWIISYMLLVRSIWFGSKSATFHLWFWGVPAISIAAEIGQSIRLVPGTFDLLDLVTIIAAIVFVSTVLKFDALRPRKETS